MTRDEHLKWAKARAMEYAERGELVNAINSLLSDLRKHDELRHHPGILLGLSAAGSRHDCIHWIEGFA